MAESTRDIRRRMRGITNTKQITKAMELVSSAKMRKARLRLERTRPYYTTVLNNIKQVMGHVSVNHPLLEAREVKKSLYIVIAADRGLAGGYNANINRLIHEKYQNKKDSISLITIGSKSRDFFKTRGYELVGNFVGISESPEFVHAEEIGKLAIDLFLKKEVDEINLVFTRFVSTLSYEPTSIRLLPTEDLKKEDALNVMEFEPSADEVLSFLIPKYVESSIYGALIEASCSEQGARRAAMESATDNAEEMLEELNMSYNRARQAAITNEISEIVAGADALN